MTRRYGRAPRGKRLVASVPHGHWKTSTFVAALRCTGLTAPCVLDGAINGETFLAYVDQFLCPTLSPGDVVIMDNLSSHKIAGVEAAIAACGARIVYLPPYSPELNPCEQMWDIVKDDTCNQVFPNVAALRHRMRDILQRYWEDAKSVLQLIGRDWLLVQLNAMRKTPMSV